MMGVLESNIDQLPKIAFSAMLVHLASKKLKKFHVEGARQQFWTCTGFIGVLIWFGFGIVAASIVAVAREGKSTSGTVVIK